MKSLRKFFQKEVVRSVDFDEKEIEIIKRALVHYRLQEWRQVRSVYENEVKPLDELMKKLDAWSAE